MLQIFMECLKIIVILHIQHINCLEIFMILYIFLNISLNQGEEKLCISYLYIFEFNIIHKFLGGENLWMLISNQMINIKFYGGGSSQNFLIFLKNYMLPTFKDNFHDDTAINLVCEKLSGAKFY